MIKKIIMIIVAIILIGLGILYFVGKTEARGNPDGLKYLQDDGEYSIVTDENTGCQYWEDNTGKLTPRMNINGTQICGVGGKNTK